MRGLAFAGVLILSISLQSTILARLNLFGMIPDLILVITVCYGLLYGPVKGLFLGLAGGLLLDLAGGGILGIHTLTKAVMGYGAGFLEKTVFKDNILVPVISVTGATLIGEIISYLILTAFDWQGRFFSHILFTVFPLSLYHIILTVPVYYLLLKIFRWDRRQRGKGGIEV